MAWRGAAVALLLVTGAIVAYYAGDQVLEGAVGPSLVPVAANVAVAAALGAIVVLVVRFTFGRRRRRPLLFIGSAVCSLVLLVTLPAAPSLLAWGLVVAVVMIAVPVVGYVTHRLVWRRVHRRMGTAAAGPEAAAGSAAGPAVPRGLVVAGAVALVAVVGLAAWLAWPGDAPPPAAGGTAVASTGDALAPGDHAYDVLTYGSGEDPRRPAFGAGADFDAPPVDATGIISGWSPASARTAVWGFGPDALPRNGTIWLPEGSGPFPLVLMVHGNNSLVRYSDTGLAYLGEMLASHGIMAASIDESFISTTVLDRQGPVSGLGAARAWLILEHLAQFDAWNQEAGHPLEGRIAMDAIGLIGHSRGGEAVATAAQLNQATALPDHPDAALHHGFGIRAVMGLAPSDGLYQPGGEPVRLDGVSFLGLQGTWDGDVIDFGAEKAWQRAAVSDGSSKTMVYIERADHSQFNTGWGRYDAWPGLAKNVQNTAGLVAPADQRQVATTYAGAFFSATLLDEPTAFEQLVAGVPGAACPPAVSCVQRSAAGDVTYLLTDEDDRDPATGADGTTVAAEGSSGWEVIDQPVRGGPSYGRVTRLRWDGSRGEVALRLTVDGAAADAAAADAPAVWFDLADARSPQDAQEPLALAVEVTDRSGRSARIDAAQVGPVPTPLDASYLKWSALQVPPTSVPLFQTFGVPLAPRDGQVDLARLQSISLVFPGDAAATVLVDNVGLGPAAREGP